VLLLVLERLDVDPVLDAETVGLLDPVFHLEVFVELVPEFEFLVVPAFVESIQLLLDVVLHIPQLPLAHDLAGLLAALLSLHRLILVLPGLLEDFLLLERPLLAAAQFVADAVFPCDPRTHVLLEQHQLPNVFGAHAKDVLQPFGTTVLDLLLDAPVLYLESKCMLYFGHVPILSDFEQPRHLGDPRQVFGDDHLLEKPLDFECKVVVAVVFVHAPLALQSADAVDHPNFEADLAEFFSAPALFDHAKDV